MKQLLLGLLLAVPFSAFAILSTEPSVDTPVFACSEGRCYCDPDHKCYTTGGHFIGKGTWEDYAIPGYDLCNQVPLSCMVIPRELD